MSIDFNRMGFSDVMEVNVPGTPGGEKLENPAPAKSAGKGDADKGAEDKDKANLVEVEVAAETYGYNPDIDSQAEEAPQGKKSTETTATETTPPDESHSSSSDHPFSAFARALRQEGVIGDYDETKFNESFDGIKELIQGEIDTRINEFSQYFINELPDELKDLMENYREGVPFHELIQVKANQSRLDGINESKLKDNETLQKQVIRDYLRKTTRFADAKIDKLLERYQDLDELEAEAVNALTELKELSRQEQEELKKQAKQQEQEQKRILQQYIGNVQNHVDSLGEVIPGIPVTKQQKQKIAELMLKPSGTDASGNNVSAIALTREKNPVAFDTMLAYLYSLGVFNLDAKGNSSPDWSKVITAGERKAVREFEKALEKETSFKQGKVNYSPEPDMSANLKSMAELSERMRR